MDQWLPIETAPKNPVGTGVGPWILIWSSYDHGIYQARWETRAENASWKGKGAGKNPQFGISSVKYWMPLPASPLGKQA